MAWQTGEEARSLVSKRLKVPLQTQQQGTADVEGGSETWSPLPMSPNVTANAIKDWLQAKPWFGLVRFHQKMDRHVSFGVHFQTILGTLPQILMGTQLRRFSLSHIITRLPIVGAYRCAPSWIECWRGKISHGKK